MDDIAHPEPKKVIARTSECLRRLMEEGGIFLPTSWQSFYTKFDFQVDLSNLIIPEKKQGFDRLIVVAKGLTPNQVYDWCASKFPCWKYIKDLNGATKGLNDREPTETYAIWVRDRVEADEENKNLSADELKGKGIKGQTLTEYLLQGLKYHDETNDHLDKGNITLCFGSRDSDGNVPSAHWLDSRFQVYWYYPGLAHDDLRGRSVVSL